MKLAYPEGEGKTRIKKKNKGKMVLIAIFLVILSQTYRHRPLSKNQRKRVT